MFTYYDNHFPTFHHTLSYRKILLSFNHAPSQLLFSTGLYPVLLDHETLCFILTSTLPSSTSLASIAAIKIERMLLLEVV